MAFPLQQAPAGAIDKRQAFYLRCLAITIAIALMPGKCWTVAEVCKLTQPIVCCNYTERLLVRPQRAGY
ncbi:MAG TPA: hypothetical protein DCS68_05140, partial [Pantoea agglomerans]|nr:hypothetical protein [Pantoea agglomerans]